MVTDVDAARRGGRVRAAGQPFRRVGRRVREVQTQALGAWLSSFARRHWLIIALVCLGAAVRALVMVAYSPAFWYDGDSGDYISLAWVPGTSRLRGIGYPAALWFLRHLGASLAVVAALQHLAGIAVAVAVYAFLRHRGVGAVLASVAAVPPLFDSLQIDLEHFILTETLYTTLLVAAIGLLLWRERPTLLHCAGAGVALGMAWATRPIAIGVAIMLGLYLLLRRVGWRRIAVFAVAFALPCGIVLAWVGDRPNVYTTGSLGLITFGRAAMVADCDRVDFTPQERKLCPDTPRDERFDRVDAYTWNHLTGEQIFNPAFDPVLLGFATKVIAAQPGDYAMSIVRETLPYFLPWQDLGPQHRALAQVWVLPATVRHTEEVVYLAGPGFQIGPEKKKAAPPATGLTRTLHWYGDHVRTPPLLNTAALILAIVALLRLRRREQMANAWAASVCVAVAVALPVAQVVFGMYESRYGLPSLPLSAAGAALAWHALRVSRRSTGAPAPEPVAPAPPASPVVAGES